MSCILKTLFLKVKLSKSLVQVKDLCYLYLMEKPQIPFSLIQLHMPILNYKVL